MNKRSFALLRGPGLPVAFAVALSLAAPSPHQSIENGLIMPSDLQYLGAFRQPDGPPEIGWGWSGEALTYDPSGNPGGPEDGFPGSLFGTGHNWNTDVSEISIPAPVISSTKNLADLPVATTLQAFQDIRGGLFGALEIPRVGLEYMPAQGSQTGGKLYFAWAQHMGEGETNPSHGWAELNLAAPQTAGAWRIGNYWNYITGDYLFAIPEAWADLYGSGRTLATGRFRDGGQGSQGPTIFAIAPWESGNPPAAGATLPATPVLLYGNVYTAGSPKMTDYSHADEWTGGAWLTYGPAAAVIFAGTKGLGTTWYGCSDGTVWPDEPPYPPACPERGWWSDRFESQILFYNPADLAKAAQGIIGNGEPQPYAVAKVDDVLYHITSTRQKSHLGAMAYDRTRGFIFIMEPLADDDKSIIHVWKIKSGAGSSPITVTSPNGGESWAAGSVHNIAWTTTAAIASVKLEFSTDNGTSWTTIVASVASTGTYSWTVPNSPSTACLLRASDAANAAVSDQSDAVFSISNVTAPTIRLSRTQLYFGTQSGGTGTAAQPVVVSNAGGGTLNWTAAPQFWWITATPTSGTGAATVEIEANAAGLSLGDYSGNVTFAAVGASNTPQTITVNLRVYGGTNPPFGIVDTPIEGTTGIEGSVPVTGWALDDIEVASVKIYRDPVAGEGPGPNGYVYIGDAVFVEGARPDIEQAYPNFPLNTRAGWGYMMLTNFLPNQGNGTFVIHAIAADKEGNTTLLGSKRITCDNAHAVLPFGAIDVPAQGGTASGSAFRNFAWVLATTGKCIPTDGSTLRAFVDGLPMGHPHYGYYRVDIATLFPGFCSANTAIGYIDIDTTPYANGVHTIVWSATDSAGVNNGFGSRYFTIRNSAGTGKTARAGPEAKSPPAPLYERGDRTPVTLRRGYDPGARSQPVYPDKDGVLRVEIRELERVEIGMNGEGQNLAWQGYLKVGDELRPLPIGSSVDPRRGAFAWSPGPGFIGEYEFLFLTRIADGAVLRRPMTVKIIPLDRGREAEG